MAYTNPGPSQSASQNLINAQFNGQMTALIGQSGQNVAMILPQTYLFSNLPVPSSVPIGTQAITSDKGLVRNTGYGWMQFTFLGCAPIAVMTGDSISLGGNYSVTLAGSAINGSGNTITVTVANHGMFVGRPVFINGANDPRFNGVFVVTSYVSSSVFTVASPNNFGPTPVTDASTTITVIDDYRYTSRHYLAIANANNGWPIDRIYNRCASGTTTAFHLSRLTLDVLPLNPDIIMYSGGTNDLRAMADTTAAIPGTVQAMIANIQAMAQLAINNGSLFLLNTMTPFDSGAAGYSNNRLDAYNQVQTWIRQFAASTKGVLLNDLQALMADSTTATSNFLTSPALYSQSDKIHPSDFGAYRVAVTTSPANEDLSTLLGIILPKQKRYGVISQRDDFNVTTQATNYAYNPLMQGAGGTVAGTGSSGTAPNTWTVTNGNGAVTVWSVASRSDGLGNDLVATVGASGTGQLSILGNDVSSQVTAGSIWQLSGNVQGSGMSSNITSIEYYIDATIDGVNYTFDAMIISQSGNAFWQDNFNLLLKTFPIQIPSGRSITLWRPRLNIQIGTAGSGPVFKLGMVELRKRVVT